MLVKVENLPICTVLILFMGLYTALSGSIRALGQRDEYKRAIRDPSLIIGIGSMIWQPVAIFQLYASGYLLKLTICPLIMKYHFPMSDIWVYRPDCCNMFHTLL